MDENYMMRKKKNVFKVREQLAGFAFFKPFTVVQAVNLKSLLRLGMTAFWYMCTIFSNLGYVKLYHSEAKRRELLNKSVYYCYKAELSVKASFLQRKENALSPSFVGIKDIADIEAVFSKLCEKHSFYVDNIDEPLYIVFGGDKWDTSTKFHLSIVTCGVTASVYNNNICYV